MDRSSVIQLALNRMNFGERLTTDVWSTNYEHWRAIEKNIRQVADTEGNSINTGKGIRLSMVMNVDHT